MSSPTSSASQKKQSLSPTSTLIESPSSYKSPTSSSLSTATLTTSLAPGPIFNDDNTLHERLKFDRHDQHLNDTTPKDMDSSSSSSLAQQPVNPSTADKKSFLLFKNKKNKTTNKPELLMGDSDSDPQQKYNRNSRIRKIIIFIALIVVMLAVILGLVLGLVVFKKQVQPPVLPATISPIVYNASGLNTQWIEDINIGRYVLAKGDGGSSGVVGIHSAVMVKTSKVIFIERYETAPFFFYIYTLEGNDNIVTHHFFLN